MQLLTFDIFMDKYLASHLHLGFSTKSLKLYFRISLYLFCALGKLSIGRVHTREFQVGICVYNMLSMRCSNGKKKHVTVEKYQSSHNFKYYEGSFSSLARLQSWTWHLFYILSVFISVQMVTIQGSDYESHTWAPLNSNEMHPQVNNSLLQTQYACGYSNSTWQKGNYGKL